MKVLVVDDNVQNLYMLKALLSGTGYQVVTAPNGAAALEHLRHESFELIISDILMPQMDGFQLCHEIKQDPQLSRIPFVVYTATYTSPEDENFALSLGADAFVIKPTEPEQFLEIIRSLLAKVDSPAPSTPAPTVAPTEQSVIDQEIQAETTAATIAEEELDYFRQYNVRLVNKLESKMLQLHDAYRDLEASERLFHTLAETAPVGICRLDHNGALVYANDHWYEILGHSKQDSRSWLEGVREVDRPKVRSAWERTLAEHEVFCEEFRVGASSQEEKWILGHAKAVPADEIEAVAFVGAFTDITAQKCMEIERAKLQATLHQSQKLEAIGSLVSGISHDFNNFLTAILGFAELARYNLEDNHAASADIDSLIQAAERAKKLTQQILWFSRKQTEGLEPIQIQSTVREALAMLRGSIPPNVDVVERFAKDIPNVNADSTQIHQIILNLITNAIHALRGKGGELEVELEPILVDAATCASSPDLREGNYVCLTVRDTGHGIPKEHLARIFDPFFTTKGRGEGTGMGLSVVHGIVKRHGGVILVDSEVGAGTTFRVFLPAASQPATVAHHDDSSPTIGHGERILFVDDDESLTSLAERMLLKLGYQPIIASNAHEALAFVAGDPETLDLVVTDLNMPNLAGMELAERIWKLRPGTPIIALTGNQREFSKESALDDRIADVVFKPFSMGFFADAIARVLAASR
jgi:PAS domain S-box-containing protein